MPRGRNKKPPELDDYIEHTCSLNGRFEGTVIQLLGMQFVYETGDGNTRFCMYREDWKHIDESNSC